MGGCDKQGFPMKQGVLIPGRASLLMHRGKYFYCYIFSFIYFGGCWAEYLLCNVHCEGTSCFRGFGRRNGERRRKSVRGCIVSPDLSVLNLVIVKQGMISG